MASLDFLKVLGEPYVLGSSRTSLNIIGSYVYVALHIILACNLKVTAAKSLDLFEVGVDTGVSRYTFTSMLKVLFYIY